MPDEPKDRISSEELIRRAREGLDSDQRVDADDFQLPSYTAVRREAEAARAERSSKEAEDAEADRDAAAERYAAELETPHEDPTRDPYADLDQPDGSEDEVAAGYGSLEDSTPAADAYGPVVTPAESAEPPPATVAPKRRFQVGWLRWVIAAGFIGFALFRFFDPSTSVDNLAVGDCFDDPGGNEIQSVDLIDCTTPHQYEIYALIDLVGNNDAFPGDDALFAELAEQCFNQFQGYVGHDYASSIYDFSGLTPLEDSWENGDREGICLVHRFDDSDVIPPKTSSARNAGI